MRISISDWPGKGSENAFIEATAENAMFHKGLTKTPKRERTAFGVNREKTAIRDLWKEMWAGTGETNRRLRWRRWDRDLDFR
jgi:hypothetical protein